MSINSLEFRKTLANLASSVCIISTVFEEEIHGITISSFTSLSLDPPMILFCLGKHSKKYQYFQDTKLVGVSILNSSQDYLSNNFSRNHENYWDSVDIMLGEQSKCPIIKDSLGFLECGIEAKYDGGDHTIFTAKVINHGKLNDLNPLIHFRSGYWAINSKE